MKSIGGELVGKVSVIIPVYNTEQYIVKCLESVINQTYKDIEIIIVNDGSTDNSEKVILKFVETHKNIKYIYQENKKQGAARNTGLKNATGKYVMFVDSDDYLPENSISILRENIRDTNLVIGNMMKDENGVLSYVKYIDSVIKKASKKKVVDLKLLKKSIHLTSPCNKLYERQLLVENNIYFSENMVWEDGPYFVKVWMNANGISYVDEVVYIRSVRNNINNKSTTQLINEKIIIDDIKSYSLSLEECMKFKRFDFVPEMLFYFYRSNMKRVKQLESTDKNRKQEIVKKIDDNFNKWLSYLIDLNGYNPRVLMLLMLKKIVKFKYQK